MTPGEVEGFEDGCVEGSGIRSGRPKSPTISNQRVVKPSKASEKHLLTKKEVQGLVSRLTRPTAASKARASPAPLRSAQHVTKDYDAVMGSTQKHDQRPASRASSPHIRGSGRYVRLAQEKAGWINRR
ncbi:hypothetical protein KIPB_002987 [Kipferlia bialata]|uniref:Uncharacterized protein n=1 Tax=Kipferlia bialata TaxID=797122 RepID=A0A391NJQ9_9EUKA|nr:hypothetical protein KIPB_002987 [Kipferlia bialata]|eukprot:g2987.t1